MRFRINMSRLDQIVRMTLGCIFLATGLADVLSADLMSRVLVGIVGALALFSAVTRYCFLYDVAGFATHRATDDDSAP